MREYGRVVNHSVRSNAHHQGKGSAEANRGRLYCVAHKGFPVGGLVVMAVGVILQVREMGKHLGNCAVLLFGRRFCDGFLGNDIRPAQNCAAEKAGEAKHQDHVCKVGFNCHG